MKHIKILPAIRLANRDGSPINDDKGAQRAFSFESYLFGALDAPPFRRSLRALRMAQDIEYAYKEAKSSGKDWFAIPETHHELLVESLEPGEGGLYLIGAWNLLPFADDIKNASNEPPRADVEVAATPAQN